MNIFYEYLCLHIIYYILLVRITYDTAEFNECILFLK